MVLGSKEEMLDLTQTTRENFFVGVRELYLSNKITYFNILNFLSTFRSHACLWMLHDLDIWIVISIYQMSISF
jgi:hypothetical protein